MTITFMKTLYENIPQKTQSQNDDPISKVIVLQFL